MDRRSFLAAAIATPLAPKKLEPVVSRHLTEMTAAQRRMNEARVHAEKILRAYAVPP